MKTVFMLCNAHIDPVWQWKRDDGLAAALSTFRSAASLLEEYDFVFCHNEALVYRWAEQYEPRLFERIRRLVAAGKWKIMGGWFLQPDCNLPCAESITRQILVGRRYFREKFGAENFPAAVNVDAFGHGGGLPQILRLCGQEYYLCCRPMAEISDVPDEFIWRGIDGSEVRGLRVGSYGNDIGKAADKIRGELARLPNAQEIPVLWGVGNHGGGPSRADLEAVGALRGERKDYEFVYAAPEEYFRRSPAPGNTVEGSLYPCFPGCYSAQIEIKQAYRRLENLYYAVEKMAAEAELLGFAQYPSAKLERAQEILLFSQFHDILAGTSVRAAYEESLHRICGGLDILNELRTDLMLAATADAAPAGEEEYPIFVFNPHPYEAETVIAAPVMMSVRYYEGFADAEVYSGGARVPSQVVKEDSCIPIEWAKKVVFRARLRPAGLTRFDLKFVWKAEKPVPVQPRGDFVFECSGRRIVVGRASGLLESYAAEGYELLSGGGFCPVLCSGNEDPWAMQKYQQARLGEVIAPFRLASPAEAARLCNLPSAAPVRLIEDGEVLAAVQAMFVMGESSLVQTYWIDKKTGDVRVDCEVRFNHPDKMIKLLLPCAGEVNFSAQVAGGMEEYPADGAERVMHRFAAMRGTGRVVAVCTDSTYSVSARGGCMELTLLRSAVYTGHYISEDRKILPQDRYLPRQDMGEHRFRFLLAGGGEEVLSRVHRSAQLFNEPPYELNVFPRGKGGVPSGAAEIEGEEIVLLAMKHSDSGGTLFRLENGSAQPKEGVLRAGGKECRLQFAPFEIKTCILKEEGFVLVPGMCL